MGSTDSEIEPAEADTVTEIVLVASEIPVAVPVSVITYVPGAVPEPATTEMEDVLPLVAGGLNVTVIPAGTPLAVRVTDPAKFVRVRLSMLLPVPPCWIVSEAGVAASDTLEEGGCVTVTVRIAADEATPDPDAWTVIWYVPVDTPEPTLTVMVEAFPDVGEGSNETIIPDGAPVALRVTAPEYPPVRDRAAAELPD